MKVEDKIQVLKFFSAVLNAVFLILGCSVLGCAVWILFDKGSFIAVLSFKEVNIVAGGLFVIGLVVIGVTALGCAGAYLGNRWLLLLYMGLLIIIVLGQLFVTFVLLLNYGKIGDTLTTTVNSIIAEYGMSSPQLEWKLLDNVQHYGQCCGREYPSDWSENAFIRTLNLSNHTVFPCSCFNSSDCPTLSGYKTLLFGNGTHIHSEGCEEKISSWLNENIISIVGMDVSLILIQVLQFVVVVFLYQSVGQKARLRHRSQLISSEVYPEPNQTYSNPEHTYHEPNQTYSNPEHTYHEPNQTYSNPEHTYHEPNQTYSNPEHTYHEPNHIYSNSAHTYHEPNNAYSEQH